MTNVLDIPVARNPHVVPAYLRELKRWTAWTLVPPSSPGKKPAKKPLSLTNDSQTWRTFEQALLEASGRAGIGFQMMGAATLAGIDLDGCLDPTTGAVSAFAQSLLDALPDTYAEITPSGKGLRLFARLPEGARITEFLNRQHGVECYLGRSARFLTVTGNVLPGREGLLGELSINAARLLSQFASTGDVNEVEVRLPVPTVERLVNWREMLDARCPFSRLRKEWKEFLEQGDLPGVRSERTFAIACHLLKARYNAEEVFAFLIGSPGVWEAALDKRDQDVTRARALVWADIGRAQKVLRSEDTGLQERVDDWSALGLRTEVKGKRVMVQRSQMNMVRILTEHPEWKNRVALDVTTGRVLLDATPMDDVRFFEMQEKLCVYSGWEPTATRQWWSDAVRAVADANPVNPREQELRSLTWDGTQRLNTWFTEWVAADDDALNRDLGRKWLISCVARWLDPGCKCDTVLVLQGQEGARKNTFFEIVAGAVDRVVPIDGMEKEDKHVVAEAWIAEMPEAALFRRADRNRLKNFITQPFDKYRPPYAALPVVVKRAFVLVSTANPGHLFNADQDGLRRFWPVQVRDRIAYEKVREARAQLLAEAVLAYDLGEPWWFEETPAALRDRVLDAVEATALDEALGVLIERRRGQGGMSITEIALELGTILGYRPLDRHITPLLEKHHIRPRRSARARFWLHPSWARPGKAGEADVIPLHRVEKNSEPEEKV